jgi:hypothetical protein
MRPQEVAVLIVFIVLLLGIIVVIIYFSANRSSKSSDPGPPLTLTPPPMSSGDISYRSNVWGYRVIDQSTDKAEATIHSTFVGETYTLGLIVKPKKTGLKLTRLRSLIVPLGDQVITFKIWKVDNNLGEYYSRKGENYANVFPPISLDKDVEYCIARIYEGSEEKVYKWSSHETGPTIYPGTEGGEDFTLVGGAGVNNGKEKPAFAPHDYFVDFDYRR